MATAPRACSTTSATSWSGPTVMVTCPDQEVADVVEQARGAVAILRGDA